MKFIILHFGFLQSFSTRLFLSLFIMDEFVGNFNYGVSDTLVDAVHFSYLCFKMSFS
jgi:hypothetical protein